MNVDAMSCFELKCILALGLDSCVEKHEYLPVVVFLNPNSSNIIWIWKIKFVFCASIEKRKSRRIQTHLT